MTMEERLSCLDARPEVASLNLTPDMSKFTIKERRPPLPHPRPAIDYDDCMPFTYKQIVRFAAEMQKRGIKPELEIYHPGGAWVMQDLIAQGLLERPTGSRPSWATRPRVTRPSENVLQLLREFPDDSLWLCSGIGPFQLPMTTLAIAPRRARAGRSGGQRLLPPRGEGGEQRPTRRAHRANRARARARDRHAGRGATHPRTSGDAVTVRVSRDSGSSRAARGHVPGRHPPSRQKISSPPAFLADATRADHASDTDALGQFILTGLEPRGWIGSTDSIW